MNTKYQILCAWCGPAFMAMWTIGWVFIGRYFPPHSPTFTGTEVAAFYQANTLGIRFGLWMTLLGTALFIPFSAVISIQMAHIEGRFPVISASQLAAGAGTVLTFGFPLMFWATAAFRPDRSSELLLLLDDLAWVPFAGMAAPFFIQQICIALVGFMDKSEHPIFPRWACYFNLWADILILPGTAIIFFKTGPFAWNGLFGIWIPFVVFGSWIFIMTFLLIKGIRRQAAQPAT